MNTLDTVYLILYANPQIRDGFNRSQIINYNRHNEKSNSKTILDGPSNNIKQSLYNNSGTLDMILYNYFIQ